MEPKRLEDISIKVERLALDAKLQQSEILAASVRHTLSTCNFYLAVLGEFKRGKSSLINSLLGMIILPYDVCPTTAVLTIVQYGKQERIELVFRDRESEIHPLDNRLLLEYCADRPENVEQLAFIRIYLDSPLLADGLVIIDTPGVNDLNEARAEITDTILPNCDATLFLLGASDPLKKSEAVFLESKVFANKLYDILFVLSRADTLDDDEIDEAIRGARERIQDRLGFTTDVFAYSAKQPSGCMLSEQILTRDALIAQIKRLIASARRKTLERCAARLQLATKLIFEQIETRRILLGKNKGELALVRKETLAKIDGDQILFEQFLEYIQYIGRDTLVKLVQKSAGVFSKDLANDIKDQLRLESNPQNYWKNVMPLQIERRMRQFASDKSVEITEYIEKFQHYVASEYQRAFNVPLKMIWEEHGICVPGWTAQIEKADQVSAVLSNYAPMITGMILGSLVMPGIGTVLGSMCAKMLSDLSREQKAQSDRLVLRNEVDTVVEKIVSSSVDQLVSQIGIYFGIIRKELIDYHNDNKQVILHNLELYGADDDRFNGETARLDSQKTQLRMILNDLDDIMGKGA